MVSTPLSDRTRMIDVRSRSVSRMQIACARRPIAFATRRIVRASIPSAKTISRDAANRLEDYVDAVIPAAITQVCRRAGTGKVNLLGISKRGDTYLRALLIHGARSVLSNSKNPGEWVEQMMKRRPKNVVIVALANKMARMIWAVLAHDRPYQKDYVSVKPA